MPFSIFRLKNVASASIIGILWSAAMFAWFFLTALYLQQVLGYTPLQVGLSFLPANLIMAVFSVGLSAKIVMRYGTKGPLALGMALVTLGLVAFAFAPESSAAFIESNSAIAALASTPSSNVSLLVVAVDAV